MSTQHGAPTWAVTARNLYLVAMAVFLVNITISILTVRTSSSSTATRS